MFVIRFLKKVILEWREEREYRKKIKKLREMDPFIYD